MKTKPSPLARYLAHVLAERGETPAAFADRVGINSSGFYRFLRGATQTLTAPSLGKVASALHMTPGEMMMQSESHHEDDPVERALRGRTGALRELAEAFPLHEREAVIEITLDRSIDITRDWVRFHSRGGDGGGNGTTRLVTLPDGMLEAIQGWLDAVEPADRKVFCDDLKAHGDASSRLIAHMRTADNSPGSGADNAADNGPPSEGEMDGNGRLTAGQPTLGDDFQRISLGRATAAALFSRIEHALDAARTARAATYLHHHGYNRPIQINVHLVSPAQPPLEIESAA